MTDWAAWPLGAVWLLWFLLYRFATRAESPDLEVESAWSRASYIVPMWVSLALLLWQAWPGWLGRQLVPWGWPIYGVGIALTVAGLVLTTWARSVLGSNWSGTVTLKVGHELVRSGPFRWIRHPMYSGALIAMFGTALAFGSAHAFLGVAIATIALYYKLRIEERWMAHHFGPDYANYRHSTWALLPFVV